MTPAAAPMRLCYRHPDTAAERGCEVCRRPICSACAGFGPRLESVCAPCAASERQRSARIIGAVVALGCIAVGGVAVFGASRPPAITYGEHRAEIERAHQRVQNNRCDSQSTLDLTQALLKERDYRRALDVVTDFDKACAPATRLWWDEHAAAMKLQDFARAEAAATRLMADNPDDGDFAWWRGKARRERGDVEGAINDFERASRLHSRAFFSVIDLVDLLEAQGRACEAVPHLARLVHNQPEDAKKANLGGRLHRLIAETPCPDARATLVDKADAPAVCRALPKALAIASYDGTSLAASLMNTWVARTCPLAAGPALPCELSLKASILATRIGAVRLGTEEELIKRLVNDAVGAWCGTAPYVSLLVCVEQHERRWDDCCHDAAERRHADQRGSCAELVKLE